MYLLGWRGIGLVLMAGLLVPTVVWAQPGFYLTPSFSFTEVYDDNLFNTSSGREKDFISRLSPGIQAGYQSSPLTLLGRYTFDAEVFAEHTELTRAQARQEASVEFRRQPTRLPTLSVNAAYTKTQTAGELNLDTGLETGRVEAHRFSLSPSITYRFGTLTSGTWDYMYTKDKQSGGVMTTTHTSNLVLDRQITGRDTGSLGYTLRQFVFDGDSTTDNITMSHTFTLGWTHEITPLTAFTLRGGPRFSEGSIDVDGLATIRHEFGQGDLSLTYARNQTTVIGQRGAVNTDSFTGAATVHPLRSVQMKVTPGYFRSTHETFVVKVYRVGLEVTCEVTRWLSLTGSYQFILQQGRRDSVTGVPERDQEKIYHNLFFLRLEVTYPYRVTAFDP